MRRGKLTNIAYKLVIVSAIFTVISYSADQMVIRSEDKIRTLNVNFNNLQAEVKSLESLQLSLGNIGTQSISLLTNLKQRNFWLKNIIFQKIDGKSIKESLSARKIDQRDFSNSVLYNLYNYLIRIQNQSLSMSFQFQAIVEANPKFFTEAKYYIKNTKKFDDLTNDSIEYIFSKNIEKFKIKDYENYRKIFSEMPSGKKDYLDLSMDEWFDINKLAILYLEKSHLLGKELTKLDKKLEELIDEKYLDLGIIMREIKNKNALKNYYILGSIISQILTLLFLLILFRIILINFNKV